MKTRGPLRAWAEAFVTLSATLSEEQHTALVAAFVRRVSRAGLLRRADAILVEIERLLLEREGVLRAEVQLAGVQNRDRVPGIERLLAELAGQPVKAAVTVDPRLIAGFRARVEDLVVDGSLRGSLERLRARLSRAPS